MADKPPEPWVTPTVGVGGLSAAEAARRLAEVGPNRPGGDTTPGAWHELLTQLRSPLVLLLVGAGLVSALVGEFTDALIVLAIVLASTLLGWWQEHRAGRAVEALRARVTARSRVLRDGVEVTVPAAEIVPGDVIVLSAGTLIPADARVLAARDLFVSEAALTGETFPVEKRPGAVANTAPLAGRTNAVFAGTSVRSGSGRALVVDTGARTVFGGIAGRLGTDAAETEFEVGLRQFGNLLSQSMLALTLVVFAVNVALHKPVLESLLFSVALAVGLAPELLPAILAVNLARSATAMAKAGVIVRRLSAIEDFGAIDVLCTDKTGTITQGVVRLDAPWAPTVSRTTACASSRSGTPACRPASRTRSTLPSRPSGRPVRTWSRPRSAVPGADRDDRGDHPALRGHGRARQAVGAPCSSRTAASAGSPVATELSARRTRRPRPRGPAPRGRGVRP